MSKSQKKASVSPYILGPLAGAVLGTGISFAAKPQLKDTATKENVRRLLRSLILGGGIGLGAVTAWDGGKRIMDEFKTASLKKKASSKLLAKLVKKAAGNGMLSNPNTNYAVAGGTGLLGSMLLYHFLNDKKKRNLGGYLGSGIIGLGAGLAGAGLYNNSAHGGFFGKPNEQTETPPQVSDTTSQNLENNETEQLEANSSDLPLPGEATETLPEESSEAIDGSDQKSNSSKSPTDTVNKSTKKRPLVKRMMTNPYVLGLGGLGGLNTAGGLLGLGNAYFRNHAPEGYARFWTGRKDLVKGDPDYISFVNQIPKDTPAPGTANAPKKGLVRKVLQAGKFTLGGAGYRGGTWLGNKLWGNGIDQNALKLYNDVKNIPTYEFTNANDIPLNNHAKAQLTGRAQVYNRWKNVAENNGNDSRYSTMRDQALADYKNALQANNLSLSEIPHLEDVVAPELLNAIYKETTGSDGTTIKELNNFAKRLPYVNDPALMRQILDVAKELESGDWFNNPKIVEKVRPVERYMPLEMKENIGLIQLIEDLNSKEPYWTDRTEQKKLIEQKVKEQKKLTEQEVKEQNVQEAIQEYKNNKSIDNAINLRDALTDAMGKEFRIDEPALDWNKIDLESTDSKTQAAAKNVRDLYRRAEIAKRLKEISFLRNTIPAYQTAYENALKKLLNTNSELKKPFIKRVGTVVQNKWTGSLFKQLLDSFNRKPNPAVTNSGDQNTATKTIEQTQGTGTEQRTKNPQGQPLDIETPEGKSRQNKSLDNVAENRRRNLDEYLRRSSVDNEEATSKAISKSTLTDPSAERTRLEEAGRNSSKVGDKLKSYANENGFAFSNNKGIHVIDPQKFKEYKKHCTELDKKFKSLESIYPAGTKEYNKVRNIRDFLAKVEATPIPKATELTEEAKTYEERLIEQNKAKQKAFINDNLKEFVKHNSDVFTLNENGDLIPLDEQKAKERLKDLETREKVLQSRSRKSLTPEETKELMRLKRFKGIRPIWSVLK